MPTPNPTRPGPVRLPRARTRSARDGDRGQDGRVRTYLVGPGGPLVYVHWDRDSLVCCVSMRDLKLEPEENEQRR